MNTKFSIPVKINRLAVLGLWIVAMILPQSISQAKNEAPKMNAAPQVSGYKAPWPSGQRWMVNGVRTGHTPINGVARQAIDFGTPYGTSVLAMRAGTIVTAAGSVAGGGGLIVIDTNDGYCSVYLHLSGITRGSGAVAEGQEVGKSGASDGGAVHLHVAVYTKSGNSCDGYGEGPKQREAVVIFSEVGRELNYQDWVISQNGGSIIQIPLPVFQNGSSRLWQDQNWGRANLRVCADNLPGNTVNVLFNRQGREWRYSKVATSRCIEFYDLDGAGPLNGRTTYFSRAALNQQPNPGWPIPCAGATGGQGLCDSISRP